MTNVSAEDLIERLRQSLCTMMRWAEAYEPRLVSERSRYDADLDEAETVLTAADACIGAGADPWWRVVQTRSTPDTDE